MRSPPKKSAISSSVAVYGSPRILTTTALPAASPVDSWPLRSLEMVAVCRAERATPALLPLAATDAAAAATFCAAVIGAGSLGTTAGGIGGSGNFPSFPWAASFAAQPRTGDPSPADSAAAPPPEPARIGAGRTPPGQHNGCRLQRGPPQAGCTPSDCCRDLNAHLERAEFHKAFTGRDPVGIHLQIHAAVDDILEQRGKPGCTPCCGWLRVTKTRPTGGLAGTWVGGVGVRGSTRGSKKLATLATVAENGSPLHRTTCRPSLAALDPPSAAPAATTSAAVSTTGATLPAMDDGNTPGSGPLGTAGSDSGDATSDDAGDCCGEAGGKPRPTGAWSRRAGDGTDSTAPPASPGTATGCPADGCSGLPHADCFACACPSEEGPLAVAGGPHAPPQAPSTGALLPGAAAG
eukprot:scaffold6347_cov124-Isochrysis_galbana.AAC.2